MDKMTSMASCLIRTREYYIGFPSTFTHYPEGIPTQTLKSLFEQVQSAMNAPNMIQKTGDGLRRIVIGTGRYLVIGIAGYARNLVHDDPSSTIALVDEAKRPSYGFVGFVWELDETDKCICGFPQIESFSEVFRELIVSHWRDSNNSKWAAQVGVGIPVPYQYDVAFAPLACNHETVNLNFNKEKIYTFDNSYADSILAKAITAACKKQIVSVCTDMYLESTGTPFGNLTGNTNGKVVIVTENAKHLQQATVTQTPDETSGLEHGGSSEIKISVYQPEVQQEKNPLVAARVAARNRIIPTRDKNDTVSNETDIVFLKFVHVPGVEIEKILNKLLSMLKTIYYNRDNKVEIALEQIHYAQIIFKSPQVSNIWAVQFPCTVAISDVKEVCRDILSYFCKNKILIPTTGYRCAYQSPQGLKPFRISISDEYDPVRKLLLNSEEILRVEQEVRQKNKATRTNSKAKKNTETERIKGTNTPVRVDPSFLRPQRQGSDTEKKPSTTNIEDLFKF